MAFTLVISVSSRVSTFERLLSDMLDCVLERPPDSRDQYIFRRFREMGQPRYASAMAVGFFSLSISNEMVWIMELS